VVFVMKNSDDINMKYDNDLILLSVCNDLVNSAGIFYMIDDSGNNFGQVPDSLFDVVLIPAWHHVYTGKLKTLWYRFLKPSKSAFLFLEWDDSDSVISMKIVDWPFMWKVWKQDTKIFDWLKFLNTVDCSISDVFWELAYLRIIKDYENLYILKIGKKVAKKDLNILMKLCHKKWNVIFVSDLHSGLPYEDCEKQDKNIMTDPLVEKLKHPFVVYLFRLLAALLKAEISQIWYTNTAYVDWNKRNTVWFWCYWF